jgi:ATP synthase protein I
LHRDARDEFTRRLEARQRRKLRALRQGDRSVWFGFGMFGLVGWSVAVPTVLLTAVGVWLDAHTRNGYSWTLMLLVIGVGLGCLNAWFWLTRERKVIEQELQSVANQEDKDGES